MWDWRDAWILQSIVYAGRRGALRSILANADAFNVDVPPCDELERVVQRLQAAGLVSPDDERVRATRAGKRLVRACSGWRVGIRSITPKIEGALQEAVDFPDHSGDWSLSEVEWRSAYKAYAGSARRD